MSPGSPWLPAPSDTQLQELAALMPGEVRARSIDRLAFARDASHYVLTPQAVVSPRDAEQLGTLLQRAAAQGWHLTFRSGGTSLSGQGVTDGLLVDVRRHFRDIQVLDEGRLVRVQPGATVRQVNARLAPYSRRIGPDPASEAACTIGGVVANNSSGMACGTEQNAYRTIESVVLVLTSGTVIDTAHEDADARLRALEPTLHDGLVRLRNRVRDNPESVATLRRLFALKNTMGYGLNSFLDHEQPVDLLAHLLVGSEGTLAFVAEATFRTVPTGRHAATGLLVFPHLRAANESLPQLINGGMATVELMDATALRVAQRDPRAILSLRTLTVETHAALLVEVQDDDPKVLRERVAGMQSVLNALPVERPATLSTAASERAALWHIRKGLYATVAGSRPRGTTALLEDVAVPVDRLAVTCEGLVDLFGVHGYDESVIFGHAKDGNLHFLLSEDFTKDRYEAFTEDMVDLVLGQGGTLKAEHGTGRMMAPYVRRQYGDELHGVMRELKALCDPHGILNPGVLMNDPPHLPVPMFKRNLPVEEEVDRCVECGYCEPVCPSRQITLTPRQRIVVRRELAAARQRGDHLLAKELEQDYEYDGVDTCAADGMCQTACPVLIDTGALITRLRAEHRGTSGRLAGRQAARHWDGITRTAARALDAASALPHLARGATRAGRFLFGNETVPLWEPDLPRGGTRRMGNRVTEASAILFPSCTGTMFSPSPGSDGVTAALLKLCERAGVVVGMPDRIEGLCCGTPWKSKGLTEGFQIMSTRVSSELFEATRGGELIVVCDASSCTEGLIHLAPPGVVVVDAVTFARERLLPKLPAARRFPSLALHPTCSSTRLGINDDLLTVAAAVAEEICVDPKWGCCAFAGDRGLLHPELTASATREQGAGVRANFCSAHASTNRTCEIGMTRATGEPYHHVIDLLEQVTRPI